MRDAIDNNAGIDEFNQIVNDYNSRCGATGIAKFPVSS